MSPVAESNPGDARWQKGWAVFGVRMGALQKTENIFGWYAVIDRKL